MLGVLLSQAAVGAIVTNLAGQPIGFPDLGTSRSGTTVSITLEMAAYTYNGVNVVQQTRAFNNALPGPTIRVQPGDTLHVTLINSLDQQGFETGTLHNQYRCRTRTSFEALC
jgi:FtsP/CotA-like multicopper oxidase with cupredoxin domain